MLRVYAGSGGNTLTVEEPLNNIVRVALEVLASALGGVQAIHSCSYDEAYAIPTAEAQLVALRTQQILAYESGITKTVDPEPAFQWTTHYNYSAPPPTDQAGRYPR